MSLKSETIPEVPEETARVARAAFPKGNLYLKMRDELGVFYSQFLHGTKRSNSCIVSILEFQRYSPLSGVLFQTRLLG